jgi:hypothetical protein
MIFFFAAARAFIRTPRASRAISAGMRCHYVNMSAENSTGINRFYARAPPTETRVRKSTTLRFASRAAIPPPLTLPLPLPPLSGGMCRVDRHLVAILHFKRAAAIGTSALRRRGSLDLLRRQVQAAPIQPEVPRERENSCARLRVTHTRRLLKLLIRRVTLDIGPRACARARTGRLAGLFNV